MARWENNVILHPDSAENHDYGILLSGMGAYHEESNSFHFYDEADRLIQALTLYKQNKIDTLIISGGSGRLVNNDHKEGEYLKSYLLRWGIPESDILMESDSRNTYENARNTTNRFYEPGKSYLLITSGFHMRRALACFHKQGIHPDVFPTGPAEERTTKEIVYYILPHADAFRQWNLLLKEWVGYLAYDLVGYI